MKKQLYTTLLFLTLLVTGAFAQTDLSITGITPVTNQQFPNLSTGDTFHVLVVLTNLGPDSLKSTDSVQVWLDLDWVLPPEDSNMIWTDTYEATELNSRLAGGKDTLDYSIVQGQEMGTNSSGTPLFVNIPSNVKTNRIKVKVFSFDGIAEELLNDPGTEYDEDGYRTGTGNNLMNPLNVTFGTPVSIKSVGYTKTQLNIFPNPAGNKISFTNEFTATETSIVKITDISGRIVKSIDLGKQSAGTKTFDVNISDINSGIYYMELITDNSRSIAKFTRQ